ncbi:MAG: hypothetical protein LBV77_05805 [Candidatus Adiutrix intracellularis]|nr:hypothetical protein [Candidatus Adiutrix intracellularis]
MNEKRVTSLAAIALVDSAFPMLCSAVIILVTATSLATRRRADPWNILAATT